MTSSEHKPHIRPCSSAGHEDRTATHRARWTVYGGGFKSRLLCDECASRTLARGVQRGLQIETLTPTFGGLHIGV